VKIRYFAWVRERVGMEEEDIDVPPSVATVGELISYLKTLDEQHEIAFEEPDAIRVAIDHLHVEHDEAIAGAGEIAFFPPMTGG